MYTPAISFIVATLALASLASALAVDHARLASRHVAATFTPYSRRAAANNKRSNFTAGGQSINDYCGETTVSESFGPDAPLASDCDALAAAMTARPGVFTLEPSDFAGEDGWATVVSQGTCAFAVQFQERANTTKALLGTNDIRFYVDTYARDAQDGRIQATGPIACFNGDEIVDLNWAMTHS